MSYVVLARKYRPRRFADLVGQEAIAGTLRRAVAEGRAAHAYLFSGPHGVGKTSAARVLAKALICPNVQDGEPCGACDACHAIADGRDLDVLEIDGASNRKVEEVEALRDGVGFVASRGTGSSKIYIIDEVHQLSRHAFNALLKTIEEPPPHVKFIFATTEPAKVIETIHSRCQRFHFRRVGAMTLVGLLRDVARREGFEADDEALRLLAERAQGSCRDALVGLDRAVALSGPKLAGADLRKALGLAPDEEAFAVLHAAARGDDAALLAIVERVHAAGVDVEEFVVRTLEIFRAAMLVAAGADAEVLRSMPWEAEAVRPDAASIGLEGAIHAIDRLADALQAMSRSPDPRLTLEVALLKIARASGLRALPDLVLRLEALEARLAGGAAPVVARGAPVREGGRPEAATPAGPPPRRVEGPFSPPPRSDRPGVPVPAAVRPAETSTERPSAPPAAPPLTAEVLQRSWPDIVAKATETERLLGVHLRNARPSGVERDLAIIAIPADQALAATHLKGTEASAALVRAIRTVTGTACLGVTIREHRDPQAPRRVSQADILDDPSVRRVVDRFQGSIDAVEPIE